MKTATAQAIKQVELIAEAFESDGHDHEARCIREVLKEIEDRRSEEEKYIVHKKENAK